MEDLLNPTITAVAGLEAGHYTDLENATGCTVVICREGAVGGVDVRGGSPGTRETDLLRPVYRVDRVHAILLSGGSAFGLDAAGGVVRYLEEQGIGIEAGPALVPIVSGAILFDLGLVNHKIRPGSEEGYRACLTASSDVMTEGCVGAGTGATVATATVDGTIGVAAVGEDLRTARDDEGVFDGNLQEAAAATAARSRGSDVFVVVEVAATARAPGTAEIGRGTIEA